MTRAAAIAGACVLACCAQAAETGQVLRAFVPNALLRQGEVRVVQSGGAIAVQTILYTRHPDRVIANICRKESGIWKPGQEHYDDSQSYCTALKAVPARLGKDGDGGVFRWMIEFREQAGDAGVAFIAIAARGDKDRLEISRGETLAAPPVSEAYVRKNMQLILVDVFGKEDGSRQVVDHLLQTLRTAPP